MSNETIRNQAETIAALREEIARLNAKTNYCPLCEEAGRQLQAEREANAKLQAQIARLHAKISIAEDCVIAAKLLPGWGSVEDRLHKELDCLFSIVVDVCSATTESSEKWLREHDAKVQAKALEELNRRVAENDESFRWNIDDMLNELIAKNGG